jgi:hypothetical protein
MLQNLSKEIRECLRRAEECRRLAQVSLTDPGRAGATLAVTCPQL